MIYINGHDLTIEQVIAVSRQGETVAIAPEAAEKIRAARAYVDRKLADKAVVYGLTTGFGKFSTVFVPEEETAQLQRNLIISHACGMGEPLDTRVVRAAMLLRLNALARGNSGIRLSTMETLLQMLNRGVHPIIPEKGSLGASGDLAPLSHMVLVMLGEGEAEYQGRVMPGREAMAAAGIDTIQLAAKEGLALINGTQIMTAIACQAVYDARDLAKTADIAAAMTCQALHGIRKAFDPKVHALRGQPGQITTAENLRRLLEGSGLSFDLNPDKVQDAYAIRCTPQIHGASRDAIGYVWGVVSREINAVTDNPLIFPAEDEAISGGLSGHRPGGIRQRVGAAAGAAGESGPVRGAAGLPDQTRRGALGLHDRPVRRSVHGVGEQGIRPSGIGGLHPVVGQPGGPRQHGHHRRPEGADDPGQQPEGAGHRAVCRGPGGVAAGRGRTVPGHPGGVRPHPPGDSAGGPGRGDAPADGAGG